jgi:hypothetical protein
MAMMDTICSYCFKLLKSENIKDGRVSHGVCDICKERELGEFRDALRKEKLKEESLETTWNCCGRMELKINEKCRICGAKYED